MSLLPPQFQAETLKTLGPPIRKDQASKPVEVEIKPGIWRVNGKLETRFAENEIGGQPIPTPVVIEHDVDIPLPDVSEFKPVWRSSKPKQGQYVFRFQGLLWKDGERRMYPPDGGSHQEAQWADGWEWLDEGR